MGVTTKNDEGLRVWKVDLVSVFADKEFTSKERENLLGMGLKEAGFKAFSPVGNFLYELSVRGDTRYIKVSGILGGLEIGVYNKWELLAHGELKEEDWGLLWERIRELWSKC